MFILFGINFVKSVWHLVTLKKLIKFVVKSVWYKLLVFGSTSFKISVMIDLHTYRGLSRADLRSVYRFWGHLIWVPKFKKGKKRKATFLHKNKKQQSATLFNKLTLTFLASFTLFGKHCYKTLAKKSVT